MAKSRKRAKAKKSVRRASKKANFSVGKSKRLSLLLIILALLVFALAAVSMSQGGGPLL
jgi:hypothetical protein